MGDVHVHISNQQQTSQPVKKMHWVYFWCIGWWLGLMVCCCIFPFFIKGLPAKLFGYW